MAEAVPFLFYAVDVVVAVITTLVLSVMTFGGIGGQIGQVVAICDFCGDSAAGRSNSAAKVGKRAAAAKIANTNAFYH